MSDLWYLQSNMNRGELTPLLYGRQDLETYYNGIASGLNVLGTPQGGQRKRPGTRFIDVVPYNGRLENFSYNVEQEYSLLFMPGIMRIYQDEAVVRVDQSLVIGVWASGTAYSSGNVVNDIATADEAIPYYCKAGYPAWVSDTQYKDGEYVSMTGNIYECLVNHLSTATNSPTGGGIGTEWSLTCAMTAAQPGLDAHALSTYYYIGQHVIGSDGNTYVCRRNHTSVADTTPITGSVYFSYWLFWKTGSAPTKGANADTFWYRMPRESDSVEAIYEIPIPYTSTQIPIMDYIQSQDTIIITHEDVEPRRIRRFADADWLVDVPPFSNIPQYDFDDSFSPTPTDNVQTIRFGTNATTGDRFKLQLNGILSEEVVYNDETTGLRGPAAISTEEAIKFALVRHPLTSNNYDDIVVEHTTYAPPANTYTITFRGGSANDWNQIALTYIYADATSIAPGVTLVTPGVARTEDTWSDTRGWPRTCTFHEGRLWFGGSKARTNTVEGSMVNDFYNFDVGKSFDDESISATLDTNRSNSINGIFSNRTLQIFTAGQEFYVPESPITPGTVSFLPQTNLGSKRIRPVTIDGVTLFVQETGKAIVQFLFVDEYKANQSSTISNQASHLIKNPVQMAVQRGTTSEDANYIYIVNDDGTVTVFNTLATQEVAGFTRWETAQDNQSGSSINSLCITDRAVTTLTARTIISSTYAEESRYYIEVADKDYYVDSGLTGAPQLSFLGGILYANLRKLYHLIGETVYVRADGVYVGSVVVSEIGTASWVIDSSDDLPDTATAGLLFLPEIKTMPLNIGLANGPNATSKKRIVRIAPYLYESNGVLVGGESIADETSGGVLIPNTGVHRKFILGWSLEAQATITQTTPEPFMILNIGLEVKI